MSNNDSLRLLFSVTLHIDIGTITSKIHNMDHLTPET